MKNFTEILQFYWKKPSFSGLFSDVPGFPNNISQEQTCLFALAPTVSGHLKSDTEVDI